jgi:hypothetical protein
MQMCCSTRNIFFVSYDAHNYSQLLHYPGKLFWQKVKKHYVKRITSLMTFCYIRARVDYNSIK